MGEVVSVEYDSDDGAQEAPFYVVEYTDCDREDMTEDELSYACELHYQVILDLEDEEHDAQDLDDDSECPPKVRLHFMKGTSSLLTSSFVHVYRRQGNNLVYCWLRP
jgi:hypothetical protein